MYAFISLSRDIAKRILHPYIKNSNAVPVMIYGAGAAGNEVYQTLMADRSRKVVAFYDNSDRLKGGHINNIPIFHKIKNKLYLFI